MTNTYDDKYSRIHEILHTCWFDRDVIDESGIVNYHSTIPIETNQEDIDILINNTELPAVKLIGVPK